MRNARKIDFLVNARSLAEEALRVASSTGDEKDFKETLSRAVLALVAEIEQMKDEQKD